MANTVLLKNNAPLDIQAQTHQALSAHISWMTYSHQSYEDAFFDATGASEFPEMGYNYSAWWASFSRHLEAHANAHQGMAYGLTGVVSNFYTLDGAAVLPSAAPAA